MRAIQRCLRQACMPLTRTAISTLSRKGSSSCTLGVYEKHDVKRIMHKDSITNTTNYLGTSCCCSFVRRLGHHMQPNRAKALKHLQHQFETMQIARDIDMAPVCTRMIKTG